MMVALVKCLFCSGSKPRLVALVAAGCLVLATAIAGCGGSSDGTSSGERVEPDSGPSAPISDGGSDAPSGEDASSDGGNDEVPDAAVAPVKLGVMPVPLADENGVVQPHDRIAAHQQVLAVGSRAVTLVRRWDELFVDESQPDAQAWDELQSAASLYGEAERTVLLALAVVDRGVDARPAGLTGAWDASATRSAVEDLIDRACSTFGEELQLLSIGREVDRWLEASSASTGTEFVELLSHALGYAQDHRDCPAELQVGVSASWEGIANASDELTSLMQASDVVIATYYPLDESHMARPPSSAAGDLDDLLSALAGPLEEPQVIVQEVGYPSAALAGSSQEKQQLFFEALLQALHSRRAQFPYVSVNGLNDQPLPRCEADAAAYGAADDSAAVAAWCSMGLRQSGAVAKLAWGSVIDGLATFVEP